VTTAPDPQTTLTAREIARKHLTVDGITLTPADIVDAVKAYFGDGLDTDTLQSWCLALRDELSRANVTTTVSMSWPDEQPPTPLGAPELETENARLREELEAARIRLDLLALPVTTDGLRAVLAVVERREAAESGIPERQAQLLAAIRRDGGDWSPMRACDQLRIDGHVVTRERAQQIMKQLAERGYLEPIRPRAYTYRLVTSQPTPQCTSHTHPDFVEDQTIRCELPADHTWHRNGERTWTP